MRDASRALLQERRAARIVGGRKGYLGSRTRSPTPDPKRWPIASVVRVALLGARAGAYPPPREATRVPHPTMDAASDRRARVSRSAGKTAVVCGSCSYCRQSGTHRIGTSPPPRRGRRAWFGETGARKGTAQPRPSLGVVEDDAEAHALAGRHAADPVAHCRAVGAARARHRPVAVREDDRLAALEDDDLAA